MFLWGYGSRIGDTQLGWGEFESTPNRIFVPLRTGMHHALKSSPDNDIATGDDLCPWVDVSENDDRARILKFKTGTKRAPHDERLLSSNAGFAQGHGSFRKPRGQTSRQTQHLGSLLCDGRR